MKQHTLKTKMILPLAILSGLSFSANALDIEKSETLTLSASGIEKVDIEATAGYMKIHGDSNATEITVEAVLKVNEGEYKLALEKDGDTAVVRSIANTSGGSGWFKDSPTIDLKITVPEHLELDVLDGSGFLRINNIKADVKVKDGSGEMSIESIGGNLKVDDGSGELNIKKVDGKVSINDGSGPINIKSIAGAVDIEDGSGSIRAKKLGSTLVIDDGSGSIEVRKVKGHVTISDGSGSIDLADLEDGVTIEEDGSGGVQMSNVKGNVVRND